MLMIPHTCRELFPDFFQSTEVILKKTGMWYPNRRLDFQAYAQPDCAHGPENSLALNSCLANKQNKFLELLPK